MTEEEKQEIELVKKVVDVIISGNHTIFKIEQFGVHTHVWMKELKNYGRLFLKRLMKIEAQFDLLADHQSTISVSEDFQDFMDQVRYTEYEDMKEITEMLKAFKKDRRTMLAKARKINKT